MPDPPAAAPLTVAARLRARIAAAGPLSFADFMADALYGPGGFYARGARIGPDGAFATAPTLHPAFAGAVAAEARAAWHLLGRPTPFRVVEIGPGDGSLARGLAARLADLPVELVLVDRAAGMRAQQERSLARAPVAVRWLDDVAEVEPGDGLCLANEVFDALPVALLAWPHEVRVDLGPDGRFCEVMAPATPDLREVVVASGVAPRPGGRYVVAPDAPALLGAMAAAAGRGRLLVVDYGGEGREVHDHRRPPLRCYVGGGTGGDPLQAPGLQDLTADVDFGALRRAARALRLHEVAYTTQARWLEAHGVRSAAPAARDDDGWRLARLLDPVLSFRVLLLEGGAASPGDWRAPGGDERVTGRVGRRRS